MTHNIAVHGVRSRGRNGTTPVVGAVESGGMTVWFLAGSGRHPSASVWSTNDATTYILGRGLLE